MNVAPGATFEAFSPALASGLVGTVGVRIRDGQGADFLPRATAGIAADDTVGASSIYRKTLTAPILAGQFWIVWDDGTTLADVIELVVTRDALTPFVPSGHEYVTRDELKVLLGRQNETFSDAAIDIAVEAASRACDGYKGTRFYATAETRFYTPSFGDQSIPIDDLSGLSAVSVDTDGDGVYETVWTEGTDFVLDPANASLSGQPYHQLVLLERGRRRFPTWLRSVKIEGSFGWAATPELVKQAAILIANRLLTRVGQAPLGILVAAAGDAVTTARLGRIDPDAAFLLDQISGARQPGLVSLKLG